MFIIKTAHVRKVLFSKRERIFILLVAIKGLFAWLYRYEPLLRIYIKIRTKEFTHKHHYRLWSTA